MAVGHTHDMFMSSSEIRVPIVFVFTCTHVNIDLNCDNSDTALRAWQTVRDVHCPPHPKQEQELA